MDSTPDRSSLSFQNIEKFIMRFTTVDDHRETIFLCKSKMIQKNLCLLSEDCLFRDIMRKVVKINATLSYSYHLRTLYQFFVVHLIKSFFTRTKARLFFVDMRTM